jgi:hypothetical protein
MLGSDAALSSLWRYPTRSTGPVNNVPTRSSRAGFPVDKALARALQSRCVLPLDKSTGGGLWGRRPYPDARRLLVCADAGGSNGYRSRRWKLELSHLARETDLAITMCHLPPGTSKWNKIEHRLFAHISMNSRGRLLTSHEVIVTPARIRNVSK